MFQFDLHPQLAANNIPVRDLKLSLLMLSNQKTLPWLLLVPRRPQMKEIFQLSSEDRSILMEEISQASRALHLLFAPDKINIGALGNIVPQLHIHVIARFKNDPAWPGPVWSRFEPAPYTDAGIEDMRHKLNDDRLWH